MRTRRLAPGDLVRPDGSRIPPIKPSCKCGWLLPEAIDLQAVPEPVRMRMTLVCPACGASHSSERNRDVAPSPTPAATDDSERIQ